MAGDGRPGPECGIARARERLDESGREVLDLMLEDRDGLAAPKLAAGLTQLLSERGDSTVVRASVVKHHRQGGCRCGGDS